MSEWFPPYPWSLYLLPCCTISDRRALAKTFCLPVSKAGSFLSLIWVNDIFMRLHHRRMVHHGTSISARAKGDWVSRLSQCVLLSICNTPLWVTLSKPLKPDNIILLYGHVFGFHTHWRGRFPRSKVKKKITPLKEKHFSGILGPQKRRKSCILTVQRFWSLECGLHGLLSWIYLCHFYIDVQHLSRLTPALCRVLRRSLASPNSDFSKR